MDDLTKIKGIGKATAEKLAAAGYATFAALAAATDAADLRKLQDAGFATVDIDRWVMSAAELTRDASQADQGGAGGADTAKAARAARKPASGVLIAKQEVRHLGVTYGPGALLPDTVETEEADYLKALGAAEEA